MRPSWTRALALFTALTGSAWAQVPVADVVDQLTPRHAGADCDALAALGDADEVLDALIRTADTVTMPPWVGTRAAHCVAVQVETSPLALRTAETWLSSPDTAGFALIVLGQLPHVSAPTRTTLERAVAPRVQADATFAAHAAPLVRTPSATREPLVNTP